MGILDLMGIDDLSGLLREQCGVIGHAQVGATGLAPHDLARLVRRRQLVRVHPRVYVDHTGQLTWMQRAWAAVLWAEPAALSHGSAVRVGEGPGRRESFSPDDGPIHVTVESGRRLGTVPGVVVHQRTRADRYVQELAPPRVRLEEALLDLAAESRSELDAVAVLADACGARRTTAARLLEHASNRPRLARRKRIMSVLGDAAAGTSSALEQAYVDEVARPHGLPLGERQASHRHAGDQRYRDVLLEEHRLCVELDGRLTHGTATARDRDLERDLDAAADDDLLTVRLGWGQVVDRPCRTADRLGRLLARRGWEGSALVCSSCRAAA